MLRDSLTKLVNLELEILIDSLSDRRLEMRW